MISAEQELCYKQLPDCGYNGMFIGMLNCLSKHGQAWGHHSSYKLHNTTDSLIKHFQDTSLPTSDVIVINPSF